MTIEPSLNSNNVAGIPRRHSRVLLVFVCVLAGLKFALRGPMRVLYNSGDLRTIHLLHLKTIFLLDFRPEYLASRAWLLGMDPYDKTVLAGCGLTRGHTRDCAQLFCIALAISPNYVRVAKSVRVATLDTSTRGMVWL